MFERSKQGAVDLVSGDEPLNADSVDRAARLLEECLGPGQPRIVLNLTGVPLLDSAGLEWLVESRHRCAARGGALQLAAPNPLCRDILYVTGVGDEFEIFDDVVSAVGSFAR